jgi:hypothetical protein
MWFPAKPRTAHILLLFLPPPDHIGRERAAQDPALGQLYDKCGPPTGTATPLNCVERWHGRRN